MRVPYTIDILQSEKKLTTPEIRVWCCPARVGKTGDDWYETFDTFEKALNFARNSEAAEQFPLIAYDGYELDIFNMEK